ncbi:hypothetical protein SCP_0507820 [Sparassis crispa]|uniref:Uncharacterized protein n=1 Tax=Sparassis crispa TaxID=139825 RepID=A0A401GND6_9APHY|nr:hypothetical protein SCP_0507820 [Sparassis crispa]GBE83726.1 hypothetical protein SCP_0507820 [Sparassis crispa]
MAAHRSGQVNSDDKPTLPVAHAVLNQKVFGDERSALVHRQPPNKYYVMQTHQSDNRRKEKPVLNVVNDEELCEEKKPSDRRFKLVHGSETT